MTVKRLIKNEEGKLEWVEIDPVVSRKTSKVKYDPTISQYISEKGGIKSNLDNKVYTSERSYLQHLKNNNHHIYE